MPEQTNIQNAVLSGINLPSGGESVACMTRMDCLPAAKRVAGRAAALAAGMHLTGRYRDPKLLARDAVAGSLGVQAFVTLWSATGRSLPSAEAAVHLNPTAILGTYLFRSLIVAAALRAAGNRDPLPAAFAGTAVVETLVIGWALRERREALAHLLQDAP